MKPEMVHDTIEASKSIGDYVFLGVSLGTIFQLLPAVSAFLASIWWLIRIYESRTVQRLLKRKSD